MNQCIGESEAERASGFAKLTEQAGTAEPNARCSCHVWIFHLPSNVLDAILLDLRGGHHLKISCQMLTPIIYQTNLRMTSEVSMRSVQEKVSISRIP